jgi:hypothetical protein
MAVNYSPKIVTDSLAAYWDSGTVKCYDPRENLFLRSNEFNSSPTWGIDLATGYDVTLASVGAPDGTLTGVKLYNKNSSSNFNFFYQMNTTSTGGIYTYSIYIKKLDFATTTILCGINNMAYANSYVYNFDTDTISFPFGETPGLFVNCQVIDAPNGWKRAILTFNPTAFGQTITNVGGGAYVGTGGNTSAAFTKSVYFWGAQLERNLSPSTYSATTTSVYTKSTTLNDLSGNGNNLTATNFPVWSSSNGGYFRLPTSGYFAGTGNNTLPVKNADYTLQAWIRYPAATVINGGGMLSIGTHSSTVGLYNSIRNLSNFGSFSHWWFGNNLDVSTNTAGIVANQWYMITGTYTQGVRRLYVNATQIGTDVPTENHDVPFNPTVEIGRAANNTFGAEIGPCAVYRTGLSATQVSRNYEALKRRFNA